MTPFLKVSNLTKTFIGSPQSLAVLQDVNLDVQQSSIITILGESGCGKSTFLRLLGGFDMPTAGQILFRGNPVLNPTPKISMVFQTFDQLFPWNTVLQNIALPILVDKKSLPKKKQYELALEYLNLVGLAKFKDYYPHQLSGGMKQRVAIARALAMQSEIILMDEPFASLDALTRTSLQTELLRLWDRTKVTIIFVTHNIFEAIILGERILVMAGAPNCIKMDIKNTLPYSPGKIRKLSDPGFSDLWAVLHSHLNNEQEMDNPQTMH